MSFNILEGLKNATKVITFEGEAFSKETKDDGTPLYLRCTNGAIISTTNMLNAKKKGLVEIDGATITLTDNADTFKNDQGITIITSKEKRNIKPTF